MARVFSINGIQFVETGQHSTFVNGTQFVEFASPSSNVRKERHVNAQTLTLDGALTATTTMVNLTDASGLPTDGDYKISVGEEIMNVTSRTANALTVQRAYDDTASTTHSDSSSVILIATRDSMTRLMRDALGCDWLNQSVPQQPLVTASDFSWVNQGTSSTIDNDWGGITLVSQSASPHSLRCLVQTAPSQPYTISAKIDLGVGSKQGVSGSHAGVLLRESGTGKIETWCLRGDNTISWFAWSSATAYANTVADMDYEISHGGMWLRFEHDATDISVHASVDGINWKQHGIRAKGTYFTTDADQVGFYHANYGSDGQMIHLKAWLAE